MAAQTSQTSLLLDLLLRYHHNLSMFPTLTLLSLLQSPMPSGNLSCILQPSQQLNLSQLSLKFPSPNQQSLGMRTALAWHHKQLLEVCLHLQECNAMRLKAGMILTTLTTSQICNHAQGDVDLTITATDIPHHHHIKHHQHPYQFHHAHDQPPSLEASHPSVQCWPDFISAVQTPLRWLTNCWQPSKKMTKILMKYWHHCSPMKGLPKRWVYTMEDTKVKSEVLFNPTQYQHLGHLLTCTQCQHGESNHSSHQQDSSTTSAMTSYPSPSLTSTDS